jgi:hypothetical protein
MEHAPRLVTGVEGTGLEAVIGFSVRKKHFT